MAGRLIALGGLGLVGAVVWIGMALWPEGEPPAPVTATPGPVSQAKPTEIEATPERVAGLCGACHASPAPDVLPRSEWKAQVTHGFDFAIQAGLKLRDAPPRKQVLDYFELNSPVEFSFLDKGPREPSPIRFERIDFSLPGLPAISHVQLVPLTDAKKPDLLACDMFQGRILLLKPYEAQPKLEVLSEGLGHPAHLEVVDLDGDGHRDLLVANLGEFYPTNKKCGSVTWLRGSKEGRFTPHTLLEDVGRVADVRAADLNGDGRLDLVVAAFGWRWTGEVLYLENQGGSPSPSPSPGPSPSPSPSPAFKTTLLDGRHGAIHVPIADINADGHLDIIVLTSQEHETVTAFLGDGKGNFKARPIFSGPHPAFGSTGIQLVDMNADGRLDVLYSNGDSLDALVLRPYHGVRWLENRGEFPFTEHHLAEMTGVHRAVAADFEGNGRVNVLAVSLLPRGIFADQNQQRQLDSILLLRQTGPGRFTPHTLESVTCDHPTCDAADYDGDGRIDFATGSFVNLGEQNPRADADGAGDLPWITLWRNVGPK